MSRQGKNQFDGKVENNIISKQDNINNILSVHICYVTNVIVVYYRIQRRPWTEDVDDVALLNQREESGWP
jgi:hypothetical protein